MNYDLSNFVILDILSQAQAIAKYVKGWDKNRIHKLDRATGSFNEQKGYIRK